MGSGNINFELIILYGLFKVCYFGEKYIVYIYIYIEVVGSFICVIIFYCLDWFIVLI